MACLIRQLYFFGLAFVSSAGITAPEVSGQAFDPAPTEARAFSQPDEAVEALLDVARNDESGQVAALFGAPGAELFFSGDEIEDKNNREAFVAMAGEKTRIEPAGADRVILHVGKEDWPFPIPLVKSGDGWRFDVEQGREEILNRRIGRNELGALGALNGYVEAQFEYANVDRNGDEVAEYAQKLHSDPGTFDGLFWEAVPGRPLSPLGPLVADARAEGYQLKSPADQPSPYHGYYYRILSKQGSEAPGGKYDYVINGRMIAGFGMVAFPAQYASSGIMTFIVNHQGKIYQKDLGPETAWIAANMKEYNPDPSWELVDAAE
jgi:Protein of unknown function (DUF2950)